MKSNARRFAMIALAVFVFSEAGFSILSFISHGQSYTCIAFANAIASLFIRWIPPLLIALHIEKRGIQSLGLVIPKEKSILYVMYALAGIVLPVLLVRYESYLPVEFLEQLVYIGLLEEFFYRGYMQPRFCEWLGNIQGLFLISIIFGFGHIISRIADQGLSFFHQATIAGAHAFLGGLIFGFIYLVAKNILPSAIAHVSANMYYKAIVEFLI